MARVLVLGGGFGGLEAAFNLRRIAGDSAQITLVSDRDHFYFKPNSIYVPFGLDPDKLRVPLARPTAKRGIELVGARAHGVDPQARTVETERGELGYDFLVVATGAGMKPEEVPGLADRGERTWSANDMLSLRRRFAALLEPAAAADRQRVLFLVPPNNKCSGPLYEIALMLDSWLRKHGARDRAEIVWTTYEPTFIHAFGPRLHDVVVEEFERRGITGLASHAAAEVTDSEVRYSNGDAVGYDLLVSFPPYVGGTSIEGLPVDERGFVPTDLATRRVKGHPEVYAVGDAADFPVKQAFLAFLQADAVAEQIGAQLAGRQPAEGFDPVSMCVMEQYDKATFAKVPLRLTGDPGDPIEVRPGAEDEYQVGSSRIWRVGKKMLGVTVPWRFRHGRPFHGGPFWSAMALGLSAMAALLATSGPGHAAPKPPPPRA